LHDRPADGVVFIVNPIDGDVDVATLTAVDTENGDAVLGRVIGTDRTRAWGEVREIAEVTAIQRQILHV
jgi:hypothetical protein